MQRFLILSLLFALIGLPTQAQPDKVDRSRMRCSLPTPPQARKRNPAPRRSQAQRGRGINYNAPSCNINYNTNVNYNRRYYRSGYGVDPYAIQGGYQNGYYYYPNGSAYPVYIPNDGYYYSPAPGVFRRGPYCRDPYNRNHRCNSRCNNRSSGVQINLRL